MFFELREYHTQPGKRDEWAKLMDEVIIPYQVSKGMVVVGSFIGTQDEDTYIWIRRFDSEEERVRLYAAVYESDLWKNEMLPRVMDLIDRSKHVIKRIEATPKSVIR